MNSDIRIDIGFLSHTKTKKLIRRCGDSSPLRLIELWSYAAKYKSDGVLNIGSEDIELAAGWQGEEGKFVEALLEVGFLDKSENALVLHDWKEHQPWAVGALSRKRKAIIAAGKRHKHSDNEINISLSNAGLVLLACSKQTVSNAPFLSSPNLSSPNLSSPNLSKNKKEGKREPAERTKRITDLCKREMGKLYPNFSMPDEAERCKDHHLSRGTKVKDWNATFRTWMKNAKKFADEKEAKASGKIFKSTKPEPSKVRDKPGIYEL